MGCTDFASLQAQYKKTVDDYVVLIKKLRDYSMDLPMGEFMSLWHAAEYAKDKCADAHWRLQRHMAEHECCFSPMSRAMTA